MNNTPWTKEFPGDITVCDAAGVILEMNDGAARSFAKDGGRELVGSNLLDCHPEPSRSKLQELLAAGKPNVYTIEKGGVKKLIYQSPWYEEGDIGAWSKWPWCCPRSYRTLSATAADGAWTAKTGWNSTEIVVGNGRGFVPEMSHALPPLQGETSGKDSPLSGAM